MVAHKLHISAVLMIVSMQMYIKRDGSVQPLWPRDIREIVTQKYLNVRFPVQYMCQYRCAFAAVTRDGTTVVKYVRLNRVACHIIAIG